jgi:hypothetical protein
LNAQRVGLYRSIRHVAQVLEFVVAEPRTIRKLAAPVS